MISWPPDEVERRFALLGIPNRFTPDEKERLQTTNIVVPSGNIIGFSIPEDNSGLNLLNLRSLLGTDPSKQPAFFDHPWYLDEAFAKADCLRGWHFLYSEVLQDTISQPAQYGQSLLSRRLMLPSAIEVILMLFLNYAGNREQLLQKKHTWCSDQASLGRWVTVGAFGRNGLFISGHPPEFASRGLGICGKIISE
jgi:hypothetical protein